MSEENKYSVESMVDINPLEHMRYRPAMYIGRVDVKGNLEIIKYFFEYIEESLSWNQVDFIYTSKEFFKITINGMLNFDLTTEFFQTLSYASESNKYSLLILIALSEKCIIESNGKEFCFKKGVFASESEIKKTNCTSITFKFDSSILKSKELPEYLLFNYFKRYVCIYPEKEISVYKNDVKVKGFSSNGLSDWFVAKSFEDDILIKPFHFFIEDLTLDLKAEIIFSLHRAKKKLTTITLPRADIISQNGTHAKGFLKGLKKSIREIFGEDYEPDFLDQYCNPIAVFKLSYPVISFHGPTRNKVGSEELVGIFEKQTKSYLLENEEFRKAILNVK